MDRVLSSDAAKYNAFVEELWNHHIIGFMQFPTGRCSAFFVRKKNHELRLIADPRSFNQRCRPPPHMPLGGPATWSRLAAPPHETVYVAAADVESYFFRLGLPEWIGRNFSLPRVPAHVVEALGGAPHGRRTRRFGLASLLQGVPDGLQLELLLHAAGAHRDDPTDRPDPLPPRARRECAGPVAG